MLHLVIITKSGLCEGKNMASSRKPPAPDSYPPERIISTFFRILPSEPQSSLMPHMLWFLFPCLTRGISLWSVHEKAMSYQFNYRSDSFAETAQHVTASLLGELDHFVGSLKCHLLKTKPAITLSTKNLCNEVKMGLFGKKEPPNIDELRRKKNVKGLIKALKWQQHNIKGSEERGLEELDRRKAALGIAEIADIKAIDSLIGVIREVEHKKFILGGLDGTVQQSMVSIELTCICRATKEALSKIGQPAIDPILKFLKKWKLDCEDIDRYRYWDTIKKALLEVLTNIGEENDILKNLLKAKDTVRPETFFDVFKKWFSELSDDSKAAIAANLPKDFYPTMREYQFKNPQFYSNRSASEVKGIILLTPKGEAEEIARSDVFIGTVEDTVGTWMNQISKPKIVIGHDQVKELFDRAKAGDELARKDIIEIGVNASLEKTNNIFPALPVNEHDAIVQAMPSNEITGSCFLVIIIY